MTLPLPSPNCYKLVKFYEGEHLKPYQDPAGYWTQGIGRLLNPTDKTTLPDDHEPEITPETSERWFREDIAGAIQELRTTDDMLGGQLSRDFKPAQVDALCSFIFNVGRTGWKRNKDGTDTQIYKRICEGKYEEASMQFKVWRRSGDEIWEGLVRRRATEGRLFREGILSFTAHTLPIYVY